MKTAISLPDELFADLNAAARSLKVSRSALLARAARDFLDRHDYADKNATALWNRALAKAARDPGARAFRRRTKAVIRRNPPW